MNFNKNISSILSVFTLTSLLSLTACNSDFLNTVPKTSVAEDAAYSTPAKLLAQVNNLY